VTTRALQARRRRLRPRRDLTLDYERPWVYPEQEAALFGAFRYGFVEASTKVGKTVGAIIWLHERALELGAPGREFWWVAPIYRQAEIAFERAKRYLDPALYVADNQARTIRLLNGAVLRFLSAEKPDGLYGEDVWAAVLDEATRMREAAWHAVRSTLTATRGPIRIIGNVKGRKNWVYRLARRAEAGERGMHYAKITAWHAVAAGILAREEVEDAERMLPPPVFRELYLAEPGEDLANPFGASLEHAFQAELSPAPVASWGIDLGKAVDFTVLVGLDAEGRTAAFHRWQLPWGSTIERIRTLVGATPALCDATGVGDPIVEFLQGAATPVAPVVPAPGAPAPATDTWKLPGCARLQGFVFTASSKQALLELYALAMHRGEVGLVEGPEEGSGPVVRVEHEAFEYEVTRMGVRYRAPEGMHDDTVMAYALAYQGLRAAQLNRNLGGALVAF
jgi:hypothetical protein